MDWRGVDRDQALRGGAVFLILAVPLFLSSPMRTVLVLTGVGIAIAAIRVTVGAYRKWAADRFPARYTDDPSPLVRIPAKLATGYGSYLVGFYTVVALLGIVTVIGHFT